MSDKIIDNWMQLAEYDLKTAKAMQKQRRYLYVAFTCQQAVEKLLKALFVKEKDTTPPYTHNLLRLIDNLSISKSLEDEKNIFIEKLNTYYIETRYTEKINELSIHLTKKTTNEILKETEELYTWLKKKIK